MYLYSVMFWPRYKKLMDLSLLTRLKLVECVSRTIRMQGFMMMIFMRVIVKWKYLELLFSFLWFLLICNCSLIKLVKEVRSVFSHKASNSFYFVPIQIVVEGHGTTIDNRSDTIREIQLFHPNTNVNSAHKKRVNNIKN